MSNQFNDNGNRPSQPTRMDRRRVQAEKETLLKKKHPITKVFALVLVMLTIIGSAYALRLLSQTKNALNTTYSPIAGKKASGEIGKRESFSILLMGADTGGEGRTYKGNSDTMIVATVNPKDKKVQLFSIPRDTFASIEVPKSYKNYDSVTGTNNTVLQKINSAYSMGSEALAISTIKKQLDIPIDYYMRVDFKSLTKIVDSVGGIDVDVPFTFTSAYTGGQTFTKGEMHLNGENALAYSRMRHEDPEGDYGRQKRQRQVIQAILKKLLSTETLANYQKVLNSLSGSLKTDVTYEDMTVLASDYRTAAKNIDSDYLHGYSTRVVYSNFPNGLSVEVPSTEELQRISDKIRKNLGMDIKTLDTPVTRQNTLNEENGFVFGSGSEQTYHIYSTTTERKTYPKFV
ncbi:transcriptional regulator [Companilactobacillus sp. RD055328]|uniref:LCP family protein n=1 Tax=Companilactobacillus sp. RD055328 TaxID=2916634 RepID=UPI001FC83F42|nr:LCP family protein [Companilactobacillus sp. RD055328]GKQ43475.1 transcriptional regulator [Companilactobacillus sp. RD055328]